MTVKLAILKTLAASPDGRRSIEETRLAVSETISDLAQSEEAERFAALGEADIFASGFVVRDDGDLQITLRGMELLHWLANPDTGPPPVVITTPASLAAVDAAIGLEARMKIFDLEFRPSTTDESGADTDSPEPGNESADHAVGPVPPLSIDAISASDATVAPQGAARWRGAISGLASKAIAAVSLIGNHLWQLLPGRKRFLRSVGGAAVALLGAMVIIASTVALIAYGQIRSLQSEVVSLRRELAPAKERIARLEQLEKSRQDKEAPDKPSSLKERLSGEDRAAEAPLVLSREEIQLIRDYIKPAPGAGSALPPISVGAPVTGPTFPVPTDVADKVPRLTGARFTIRSGSIVLIRKDSRHADAVLLQN